VAVGDRQSLRIGDTQPMCSVWFGSQGEPFSVTLLSRTGAPALSHFTDPSIPKEALS
jgi:hypothetical protein